MVSFNSILIFSAIPLVFSQKFDHHIYYDTNDCSGTAQWLISDYFPNFPCLGPGLPACEKKSTEPGRLTSEATGCTAGAFSSDIYFPPQSSVPTGKRSSNESYAVITKYFAGQSSSCKFTGTETYNQKTYLASGKCYATEPLTYIKASCTSSKIVVSECNDRDCQSCNNRTYATNTCNADSKDGTFSKAYCLIAGASVNVEDPPTPSPQPSAPPAGGTITKSSSLSINQGNSLGFYMSGVLLVLSIYVSLV